MLLHKFVSNPFGGTKEKLYFRYMSNLEIFNYDFKLQELQVGQLLPDECSVCLQCAKTRGQACGGYKNRRGQCGLGLRCLVRFNVPRGSDGRDEENSGEGQCVAEDSPLCPGAGVKHLEDGVNCRPGRLGIVSEALYCPLNSKEVETADSSTVGQASADDPVKTAKRPSLVAILLSNVPNPFDF